MNQKFLVEVMRHFSLSNKKNSLILMLVTLIFAGFLFLHILPFPALEKFLQHEYSTVYYDKQGYILQIAPVDEDGTRREYKRLCEIPVQVQKIFLQSEDRRFYFHSGVDFFSVCDAAAENLRSKRIVRGASTISMQVAHLIGGKKTNRSVYTKIFDIINAFRLEAKLSKPQILELYLNNVPFGSTVEGVCSAARTFFGAELHELSVEQIACLAVIPRRPSLYNPIVNPSICAEAAIKILKKSSSFENVLNAANSASLFEYPYFMPHYIRHIQENKKKNLEKQVLTVDFTLYQEAQKYLQQAFQIAQKSRIQNAAILVIENMTGNVLCWLSRGEFDGVLHKMQPGSSMKPFLYALALESGFEPNTILADIPSEFGGENLYLPTNFNNRYNGPVRFRVALASSLNVPAVKILDFLGVDNYRDFLIKLGFLSLKDNSNYDTGLSLALGGAEITLEELTHAFSIFPNDGFYITQEFSQNSEKSQKIPVIQSDTARLICSMLNDKAARALGFGYNQTFETTIPAIFKTGTSNQYQNITALGATKKYTVGVWMGNFSGKTVVGKTGSSLPATIARQILEYLDSDAEDFLLPENYEQIKICPLSAMPVGEDCPSFIYEFFKKNLEFQRCSWHSKNRQTGKIDVLYPTEYENWLNTSNQQGEVIYGNETLFIKTPQNNSIFYYDEQNSQIQALPVEISGGKEEKILVFYDGKFLQEKNRPFNLLLPIERGNHTLEIICKDERAFVEFSVR